MSRPEARRRTRPEGLIARLDLAISHLNQAEQELSACYERSETHPLAATTQILGARAACRNSAAAARMAKATLTAGTRSIDDDLAALSRRRRP